MNRWTEFALDSAITLVVGAVVVLFGVRVVRALLRVASDSPADQQRAAADRLKGGAWIGALERLAVYVCIIGHFTAGLAVVLAIKGLARYPDLKSSDSAVAERFIIGTFLSTLLAVGAGALTLWLTAQT